MKCHLTIIKWIGVLILATTCAIPGFVLLTEQNRLPLENQHSPNQDLNQTACVYVEKFYLRGNQYMTVCNQQGYVETDIRKFINGSATIIGVNLNLQQWNTLKQYSGSIDTAITEARTYWNTLKRFQYQDKSV